jgi:hypothetical protein
MTSRVTRMRGAAPAPRPTSGRSGGRRSGRARGGASGPVKGRRVLVEEFSYPRAEHAGCHRGPDGQPFHGAYLRPLDEGWAQHTHYNNGHKLLSWTHRDCPTTLLALATTTATWS